MTVTPYDFGEARDAINAAKAAQASAEDAIKDAFRQYGDAERAYRKALAIKITELRADGVAATVCLDLAKGEERIATLRYKRDVQEGVKEAAMSAVWRHTANRRELEQLISWSMRVAPDGQYDDELAPTGPTP